MMKFSNAASDCIEATGIDPDEDVRAVREGQHTRETLLEYCLDGADEDRYRGWHDYVDVIMAEAGATRESYLALFESESEAIENETMTLSIATEFLPPCARMVRDGNGPPTPEYWAWLCEQVEESQKAWDDVVDTL